MATFTASRIINTAKAGVIVAVDDPRADGRRATAAEYAAWVAECAPAKGEMVRRVSDGATWVTVDSQGPVLHLDGEPPHSFLLVLKRSDVMPAQGDLLEVVR